MAKGSKSRFRGFDPAEAARKAYLAKRNPAEWGVNDDALALAANADVEQEGATRQKTRRVQRFDCFNRLCDDAALKAVRRFQDDIATRFGVDGSGSETVQVDGGKGSRDLVSARSLDAAQRMIDALNGMEGWQGYLLVSLSQPAVVEGKQVNWKRVVQTVTGDYDPRTQAKRVRQASEALAAHYQQADQQPRRAAA